MVKILPKRYSKDIEAKWQRIWEEKKVYRFNPNSGKPIYSIDTPPPFTSGTLHMGHIYNHVWIDIVARYKRMRGYEVYLPQGFDCHGLPTELKVENELKIPKSNRDLFLKKCIEWTENAISRMKEQFMKIGYSADWDYSYRTMDPDYKALVQRTLIDFYERGILYREKHPVLWCPRCETALAKAEVGYIEREGKLYYIDLECDGKKLTIATTRPELMPACVAVLVHPDDKRYEKLVGKKAKLPIFEREVPILADRDVDMSFGTGVVYVCTFGDEQDIRWQKRYKLPIIEIINRDGTLNKNAKPYDGLKVEEARRKIAEDLIEKGYIRKIETIRHSVLSHTERSSCLAPIELLPMEQWFIKVRDYLQDIIKISKSMRWYPSYMLQRLIDWTESMDWDWIISRQRIFGTPLPFWICKSCKRIFSAKDFDEPLPVDPRGSVRECPICHGQAVGEEDVCDCWVDSSITPLVISKYLKDDEFFSKTYPATLRPQGYEIIRTWAFYTIFRCYLLTEKPCFRDLLINGMVAGPDGKKMSKSLGNVIEPEEPLNKYSADTLRQWAANGTLGEDYPFSWEELEHSYKFLNKLWNISRFIEMHLQDFNREKIEKPKLRAIDKWILSKLQGLIEECTNNFERYVFNIPLDKIRTFVWHEFADNYLEMVKHRLYKPEIFGQDSKIAAQYTLDYTLSVILRLLSPITPHICDEIWSQIYKQGLASTAEWPRVEKNLIDKEAEKTAELAKRIISEIRKFKTEKQISLGKEISKVKIKIHPEFKKSFDQVIEDIKATCKILDLSYEESPNVEKKSGYKIEIIEL